MKKSYYLFVSVIVFLTLSFFINKKVPPINSYKDIDSTAYTGYGKKICCNETLISKNQKGAPYFGLGYAFFVGTVYKLFGIDNNFIILFQILLSLFIFFLIFRITKIIFKENSAIIAFVFCCFNVGFVTFSQFILTEIFLTLFLVLFLERFVVFLYNKSVFALSLAGFFLGVSIAIKPAAIYFIFPLIFILFLFCGMNFLDKAKLIFLFCIFFYLPVIGYMTFNKVTFGNFQISALGNENLYFYLFPKVLAEKNKTDFALEHKKLTLMLNGDKLDPKSWNDINQFFIKTFLNDPIIFIKIWIKNVLKTCLGLFTTNLKVLTEPEVSGGDISFFKTSGSFFNRVIEYVNVGTNSTFIKTIGFFEFFWTILRYIFCLVSLIYLVVKRNWKIFFLFVFYIFYFSMITGHDGCARFRMMFEPVLIILASQGFFLIICSFYKNNRSCME